MSHLRFGAVLYLLATAIALPGAAQENKTTSHPTPAGRVSRDVGGPESASPTAELRVPQLVKFSGQLHDSMGQPRAGVAGLTFAIYREQEGGAPLWLENQNVEADAQGRYSVLLGAETSEGLPLEIFSSLEARWLGVQLQGEAEQPRILLVSVPYALKAADADTLGGKPASAFVVAESPKEGSPSAAETDQAVSETGTTAQVVNAGNAGDIVKYESAPDTLGPATDFVEVGGKVGIGTPSPATRLHIVSGGGSSAEILTQRESNSGFHAGFAAAPAGALSATNVLWQAGLFDGSNDYRIWSFDGTANQIRLAIDRITGRVGIGTTTPVTKLHIISDAGSSAEIFTQRHTNSGFHAGFAAAPAGGLSASNVLWEAGLFDSSNDYRVWSFDGATNQIRLAIDHTTGNIGIGTTSPTQKLDVAGNVEVSGAVTAAKYQGDVPLRTRVITYLAGCDSCDPLTNLDDQQDFYFNALGPLQITEVRCFSDAGTASINLQHDDGSAADILASNLDCTAGGASSSGFVFGENLLALGEKLDFQLVSADNTSRRVTVVITANLN